MVLAADLLSETGRIILSKGTRLTDTVLRTLRVWNVSHITVEYDEILPPNFQTEQCEKSYGDTLRLIENSFVTMRICQELPLTEMKELAVNSVLKVTETVGALQYLHSMKRSSEYTFHHSVNVSVLCGVLGKWMGYEGSVLQEIVLAGLLHDVGKSQVPSALINKPDSLTASEMEKMKGHSMLGAALMQKAGMLPGAVLNGVLQHHERMDGSGYPNGDAGESIHPFARILAVADLYDAVTSERPYHAKESPFAAARIISQEMYGKLDTQIAATFLEHIRDHFIGAQVCLTDGRQAEVVMLGGDYTFRPILRIQNGEFLDTARNSAIQIREMVTA